MNPFFFGTCWFCNLPHKSKWTGVCERQCLCESLGVFAAVVFFSVFLAVSLVVVSDTVSLIALDILTGNSYLSTALWTLCLFSELFVWVLPLQRSKHGGLQMKGLFGPTLYQCFPELLFRSSSSAHTSKPLRSGLHGGNLSLRCWKLFVFPLIAAFSPPASAVMWGECNECRPVLRLSKLELKPPAGQESRALIRSCREPRLQDRPEQLGGATPWPRDLWEPFFIRRLCSGAQLEPWVRATRCVHDRRHLTPEHRNNHPAARSLIQSRNTWKGYYYLFKNALWNLILIIQSNQKLFSQI